MNVLCPLTRRAFQVLLAALIFSLAAPAVVEQIPAATLDGVVNNYGDKAVAGMQANSAPVANPQVVA